MRTILIAMLICICLPSCSTLGSACDRALPVLSQATSLIQDAQIALDQAETAIDLFKMDDDARAKAVKAIASARQALRASAATMHAASTACSRPDLATMFDAFLDAWEVVRDVFGQARTAGVVPSVKDPVVWSMLRKGEH